MFAGSLVEAKLYTDEDTGSSDLKLSVNNSVGSTMLGDGAVDCTTDKTVYTFTCNQNNTFSVDDVVRVHLTVTNAGKYCTMTTKWKIG